MIFSKALKEIIDFASPMMSRGPLAHWVPRGPRNAVSAAQEASFAGHLEWQHSSSELRAGR